MSFGGVKCSEMQKTAYTCPKCVDGKTAVKNGKTKNGKQRYLCKHCRITFLKSYTYNACNHDVDTSIRLMLKEGISILSTSRLLRISKNTVSSRILTIASSIKKPVIAKGRVYELDEMCTFIENKDKKYWVAYAIDRKTRLPVDLIVGKRTNKTLRKVVDTLILSEAQKIYTDKLRNYKYLIPKEIHSTKWRGTNGIENMNLGIRTNLRRLQKKTICFSKSQAMLVACLKIFFWG